MQLKLKQNLCKHSNTHTHTFSYHSFSLIAEVVSRLQYIFTFLYTCLIYHKNKQCETCSGKQCLLNLFCVVNFQENEVCLKKPVWLYIFFFGHNWMCHQQNHAINFLHPLFEKNSARFQRDNRFVFIDLFLDSDVYKDCLL